MNVTPSATQSTPANAQVTRHWSAEINLELSRLRSGTRLTAVKHQGPLRIQKPFAQSDGSCHLYLLHPPGGVVGGDTLTINVDTGAETQSLITSTSATRFYRSLDPSLKQYQQINLRVGQQAHLDWVPLETILFEGSAARMFTEVHLDPTATYVGWEMLALGRRASGESFEKGSLTQSMRIFTDELPDQLLHRERFDLGNETRLISAAPFGLSKRSLIGTLVAVFKPGHETIAKNVVKALQAQFDEPDWGASVKERTIVVRYLGHSAEVCRRGFETARAAMANAGLFNREGPGPYPRIWNT